jgi:hypothetical protein
MELFRIFKGKEIAENTLLPHIIKNRISLNLCSIGEF